MNAVPGGAFSGTAASARAQWSSVSAGLFRHGLAIGNSPWNPAVWLIIWRMVMDAFSPVMYGRYLLARSSSDSVPESTSDMITAPDSHFVADAIATRLSFGQGP